MGAHVNDYLNGAEADLLRRGQTLFGKIPLKLPAEFNLLTQKCRDELTRELDALQTIKSLPLPSRLRKFKRIVAQVDFLEVNGFAALNRANEDDKQLNVLVQRIVQEINYPLLPPAVTLLSQGYFYIWPLLGLLGVPLGESDSLLHLPDLYHELAHPLVDQRYEPRVQPFRRGLLQSLRMIENYIAYELGREDRSRGPKSFRYYLGTWMKAWTEGWLIEFYCDLFAIYTLGPAFAWAHIHLCAKRGVNPFEVSGIMATTHPADDARMTVMLHGLRYSGFVDEANLISHRWKEYIDLAGYKPEPEFQRCYSPDILLKLAQVSYEAVETMGCRIATPRTNDLVHNILNGAWARFWQNPKSYPMWEVDQVIQLHEQLSRR
jgi:hypothetical protein